MTNNTAIVVFAHGSSVEAANEGVRAMTAELARRGDFSLTDTAFLEMAKPDLPASAERLIAAGARRLLIVPFFLTLGIHLRRDLPGIVDQLRIIHPGVDFQIAPPLEGHPSLVDVMLGRARDLITENNAAGQTD